MLQITFRAMGCQMQALVDDDSAAASAALAQVPVWFEGWEATLSRFRGDSELTRLNAIHQQPVAVSPVLWQVVDLAFAAARESDGLVTPTQLAALEAAGYDRSFDELSHTEPLAPAAELTPDQEWQPPRPAPDLASVVTRDAGQRTLCLAAGVRLDLGGVATGWAADEAARRLGEFGPALVDAGGDIAVSGARAGGLVPSHPGPAQRAPGRNRRAHGHRGGALGGARRSGRQGGADPGQPGRAGLAAGPARAGRLPGAARRPPVAHRKPGGVHAGRILAETDA